MITFAVITCSDTRSEKEDTAGALLRELIADQGWQCAAYDVVKDERPEIAAAMSLTIRFRQTANYTIPRRRHP